MQSESFSKLSRDWYLATALYDAIDDGDIRQAIILLLEKCACPNIVIPDYGMSPLHLAIGHNCESFAREVTKLILRSGGNSNIKADDGITPLHIASAWNKPSLVRLLLSYGADPWLLDDNEKNAFHHAYEHQAWESLKALDIFRKIENNGSSKKNHCVCDFDLDKVIIYGKDVQAEYKAMLGSPKIVCSMHSIGTQTEHSFPMMETKYDGKKTSTGIVHFENNESKHVSEMLEVDEKFDWFRNMEDDMLTVNSRRKIMSHRKGSLYEFCPKTKERTDESSLNLDLLTDRLWDISSMKTYINLNEKELQNITFRKTKSTCKENYVNNSVHDSLISEDSPQNGCNVVPHDERLSLISEENNENRLNKCEFEEPANLKNFKRNSLISEDSLCDILETLAVKDENHQVGDRVLKVSSIRLETNNLNSIPNTNSEASLVVVTEIKSTSSELINSHINNQSEIKNNITNKYLENGVIVSKDSIINRDSNNFASLLTEDESELESEHQYNECNTNEEKTQNENRNLSSPYVSCHDTEIIDDCCNHRHCDVRVSTSTQTSINSEVANVIGCNFDASGEDDDFKLQFQKKEKLFIVEQYKYTDDEEGVILIENRLPGKLIREDIQTVVSHGTKSEEKYMVKLKSEEIPVSSDGTVYDTDNLRKELKCRGFNAGPITKGTKKLYLRKLKQIKTNSHIITNVPAVQPAQFAPQLQLILDEDDDWQQTLSKWSNLEAEMTEYFLNNNAKTKLRDGNIKTSFTYLLLDPNVTRNLPQRYECIGLKETWHTFVQAIFYIGKGKNHRPYTHLYEAFGIWNRTGFSMTRNCNMKVKHILEIWKGGLGVVCLHVFQNVTSVEASTREAAMIDGIGLPCLKNERCGAYYGNVVNWTKRRKQCLGVYLLYRAMMVLLADGERQLKPNDID